MTSMDITHTSGSLALALAKSSTLSSSKIISGGLKGLPWISVNWLIAGGEELAFSLPLQLPLNGSLDGPAVPARPATYPLAAEPVAMAANFIYRQTELHRCVPRNTSNATLPKLVDATNSIFAPTTEIAGSANIKPCHPKYSRQHLADR